MRGQQVQGCSSPLPRPSITPSPQFPSSWVRVSWGPGGAEPGWSQVCRWQLGTLGCLNHDPGGRGEVKSCTPVSQLAGWEGEDLASEPSRSQGSAPSSPARSRG